MNYQRSHTKVAILKKSFLIADLLEISDTNKESELNTLRHDHDDSSSRGHDLYQEKAYDEDYPHLNESREHESSDRYRSRTIDKSRSRSRSRSSSGSSCNLKKNRKSRTAFSDYQLNYLEKSFEKHKYLSVQDRIELASRLKLTDTQVKTWYQNRRTKWKRQSSLGLEWIIAAAALEQQNSVHNQQYSMPNINTQSTDYSRFLQNSNNAHGSAINPNTQSIDTRDLQNGKGFNEWFVNALTQYSLNNNMNKSENNLIEQNISNSEQTSICY